VELGSSSWFPDTSDTTGGQPQFKVLSTVSHHLALWMKPSYTVTARTASKLSHVESACSMVTAYCQLAFHLGGAERLPLPDNMFDAANLGVD
jgi:hypothetical protein